MALSFIEVDTSEDISRAADVAHDIWFDYWPNIIGIDQTEYMVANMQSAEAIARDISENGYRYWLVVDETGETVAYTAVRLEDFTDDPGNPAASAHGTAINKVSLRRLFVSKIYLYANQRGKHYASRIIEFLEDLCKSEKIPAMYLTVNRDNVLAIRAYLGRGFTIIEDLDMQIGEGFVMTDHIMCKRVEK